MLRVLLMSVLLMLGVGCGKSTSPAGPSGNPTKKITWAEYEKMAPEEQMEPYVITNLDEDAKQKLAARQKQK